MKKKVLSILMAGCICCTSAMIMPYAEVPVHALTITAHVTNVSVVKEVIAIGESVQLELEWSTGAKQELIYSSSDESVATVDSNGIVTGISDGTAVITVLQPNSGTEKAITITVSSDVEKSIHYNSSELTLGTKLKKYDTIHYDNKNLGGLANVINTKGSYNLAFISEEDYVLPFDAELVGIDGSTFYIAPDIDGITYLDGRTLNVGDTIDKNTHLLCYDYYINDYVFPVFLPKYYEKYIGEGEIRVKAIDHDKKTITLEAVSETDDSVTNDEPVDVILPGDVNNDGELSVADMVLLQKWLLGVPDTHLVNWKAADFCEDGKLDVFDLCLMKSELTYGEIVQPISPTTQHIGLDRTDEVIDLLNNYDLNDYNEVYRDGLRKMFERFNEDGYIYTFAGGDNDGNNITLLEDQPNAAIWLNPYANYEDTGILYHVTYKDKDYQVYFYFTDSAYSGQYDGMSEYIDQRFHFKNIKEIAQKFAVMTVNYEQVTQLCAYSIIDNAHYYAVKTTASEDELMDFLNVLEYKKVNF